MLGQVNWTPSGDSAFVGIDTLGEPIGMIAHTATTTNLVGRRLRHQRLHHHQRHVDLGPGHLRHRRPATTASRRATDDSCDSGGNCTHTPNSTAACDDGNGCTTNDQCFAGTCVGGPALKCAPLDGCHVAGVCNPVGGTCSNPPKPDGTACDDMNACTSTDTCQAGVCTGASPVMCPPVDQCATPRAPGDMTTGMCTAPTRPDGTACDDGNLCTQGDACEGGICVAGQPVACAAKDGCHADGMCDTTTGMCSNATSPPDGTECDDGDHCTPGDTCKAGVCGGTTPDPCAKPDACHSRPASATRRRASARTPRRAQRHPLPRRHLPGRGLHRRWRARPRPPSTSSSCKCGVVGSSGRRPARGGAAGAPRPGGVGVGRVL